MDDMAKASRSQALLDSIQDLIALDHDVADAVSSIALATPKTVMVPVSPVAFMPGTIIGGNVMVGLGQDYYIERTGRQARCILERRMADLAEQARNLESGLLLMTAPSCTRKAVVDAERPRRQRSTRPDNSGSWAKGFLSGSPSDRVKRKLSRQHVASKDAAHTLTDKSSRQEPQAPVPTRGRKINCSDGREEVVEVSGACDDPIVEIREWLDESGNQTAVDLTDLGKVLETIPTALSKDNAAAGPISSVTARPEGEHNDGEYNSRAESIVSEWKESDLDSVFARLEEQEVAAEEESKRAATSPSLRPQWKKGFLGGPRNRSAARQIEATVPGRHRTDRIVAIEAVVPQATMNAWSTSAASNSFEGTVTEKQVDNGSGPTPTPTGSSAQDPPADTTASRRVSRFKARRQGLHL